MQSSFPLLSLPTLALDEVLKSMKISSLLKLTNVCPTIKRYVPRLRISSGGYDVRLGKDVSIINLHAHGWGTYSRATDVRGHSMKLALDCMNYMTSLFTGRVKRLEVCLSLLGYPISDVTDVLSIGKSRRANSNTSEEAFVDVSEEAVNALLNNVDIKRGLLLSGPKQLRSEHKKVFSVDWLKIYHANWVTMDILKKMQNKVIFLENVELTAGQVNEYIKDLRDGRVNPNLQVIIFTKNWREEDIRRVLEGLDFVRNQERQIYNFPEQNPLLNEFLFHGSAANGLPFNDSADFLRKDGVRCSVSFGIAVVFVLVWNQEEGSR